ncbi:PAS domain-containing protein [Sinorhizobium sp. BG8]|uniref:PAS domain-containing protein n=1 Tax=Sinorhizobium sp. BG8 TaxID=2613773 RepID=UPI00193E8B38|nr:PAS domain-containing protein [Sinorhizobium sp. BG8]
MAFLQEHFVRALFEDFPGAVFLVDSSKLIRGANTAATRMFLHSAEEMTGQPARLLFATDEEYQSCITKRARENITAASVDSVYRFLRRDGSTFTGQMRSTLVTDAREGMTALSASSTTCRAFSNSNANARKRATCSMPRWRRSRRVSPSSTGRSD